MKKIFLGYPTYCVLLPNLCVPEEYLGIFSVPATLVDKSAIHPQFIVRVDEREKKELCGVYKTIQVEQIS